MKKFKRWFLAVLFAMLFFGGLWNADSIHASATNKTVHVIVGAGKEMPGKASYAMESFSCRKAGNSEYNIESERSGKNEFEFDLEPGEYEYKATFACGLGSSRKETIGIREAAFIVPEDEDEFCLSFEAWRFNVVLDKSVDPTTFPERWLEDLSVSLMDSDGNIVNPDNTIIYEEANRKHFAYILGNTTNPEGEYSIKVNLPEDSGLNFTGNTTKTFKHDFLNANFNNGTSLTLTITAKKYEHTIKVPQGAGLQLYFQKKNSNDVIIPYSVRKAVGEDALELTETKDGYDIWTLTSLSAARFAYTAGGGDTGYIQSTGFFSVSKADSERTLTVLKNGESGEDDFYPTGTSDDLYTNVEGGVLKLSGKDETKPLEAFRVTQAVANDVTNEFIEPDMEYDILFGDDVIALTEADGSGFGRKRMNVKALKDSGFAVIKISYGAMYKDGTMYSALSDTNTGTVLVQVGGSSNGIAHAITQYDRGTGGQSDIRNDYDTVYFLGTLNLPGEEPAQGKGGTEYTFNAGMGTSVFIHDPIKNADTSFDNEAWRPCNVDAQGNCTMTLKDGRNPIKITKGSNEFYTVINAKKVDVTIKNLTHLDQPNQKIAARDTVGVSFEGLELPVYKMTTIYNPGWKEQGDQVWVEYTLNGKDTVDSAHIQYNIDAENTIEFKAVEGENALSQGQIHCTHMGSKLGAHAKIPEQGSMTVIGGATPGENSPWYNILPDITFTARALTAEEEKDAAVRDVEELIEKVADSKDDPRYAIVELMDALDAYKALDDAQKAKVSAECKAVLNAAYYDRAETDPVRLMADAIREIQKLPDAAAKENAQAIQSAREKLDALGEENAPLIPQEYRDKLSGLVDGLDAILVSEVIDKITDLGEVTADNCIEKQEAIRQAREAYEALSDGAKAKVTNLSALEAAEELIRTADPAMAAVEDKIKAIGEATAANWKEKQEAIEQARAAYEALSEESKARVSNLKALTDAEAVVSAGQAAEAIAQIASIGDVTADNWMQKQAAIGQARAAYDALPESAKALVSNLGRLTAAEATVQNRTAAVNDAVNKINAIGNVTADNWKERKEAVSQARAAYDGLSANEKAQITGAQALTAAEAAVDQEGAKEAIALIEAIGDVTADNWGEKQTAIGQARTAYNALSENAKKLVTNLTALEEAERLIQTADAAVTDAIAKIESIGEVTIENWSERQTAITEARTAYDALTPEQKALVTNYPALTAAERSAADAQAVKAVVDKIAAIGEMTIENWKEKDAAVEEARTAYDALSESQKALASNYAALQEAERFIQTDVVDPVKAKIDRIGALSEANCKEKEPLVKEARAMYDELTDRCKAMVSNRAVLENAEAFLSEYNSVNHEMKAFQESAPQGLKAKAISCTAVQLDWKPLKDADSYRIYRRPSGGAWSQIAEVAKCAYKDGKAAVGKAYAYKVAGVSNKWVGKAVSGQSAIANCTLKLGKTTLASVKSKDYRTLKLAWRKVPGASGYEVRRSTKKNGEYKAIARVKKGGATAYEDAKRATGVTYYYKVRAYRTVSGETGYGEYSSVKGKKATPAAPKVSVKKGRRSATIKWSGVKGASGYQAYRSTKKGGGYKKIADVKKKSYADKGLKRGKTYYYKVRAYRIVNKKRVYGSFSAAKAVRAK